MLWSSNAMHIWSRLANTSCSNHTPDNQSHNSVAVMFNCAAAFPKDTWFDCSCNSLISDLKKRLLLGRLSVVCVNEVSSSHLPSNFPLSLQTLYKSLIFQLFQSLKPLNHPASIAHARAVVAKTARVVGGLKSSRPCRFNKSCKVNFTICHAEM